MCRPPLYPGEGAQLYHYLSDFKLNVSHSIWCFIGFNPCYCNPIAPIEAEAIIPPPLIAAPPLPIAHGPVPPQDIKEEVIDLTEVDGRHYNQGRPHKVFTGRAGRPRGSKKKGGRFTKAKKSKYDYNNVYGRGRKEGSLNHCYHRTQVDGGRIRKKCGGYKGACRYTSDIELY